MLTFGYRESASTFCMRFLRTECRYSSFVYICQEDKDYLRFFCYTFARERGSAILTDTLAMPETEGQLSLTIRF
jgi:hypothetical protein